MGAWCRSELMLVGLLSWYDENTDSMNSNKEINFLSCDRKSKGICTVQGEPAERNF